MSQIRGDESLRGKCAEDWENWENRADGRGSGVGLFSETPNGSAAAKSAPVPYDQLSGFHLGLVVAIVLMVGGRAGRGG